MDLGEKKDNAIPNAAEDPAFSSVPKPVQIDNTVEELVYDAAKAAAQKAQEPFRNSDVARGYGAAKNFTRIPAVEAQKLFSDIGTKAIADKEVFGASAQNSVVASILRQDGIEYALDPGSGSLMQSSYVNKMLSGEMTKKEVVSQAVSQDIAYLSARGIDVQNSDVPSLMSAVRKGSIHGRKLSKDEKVILEDLIDKRTAQRYMARNETLHKRSLLDSVYDSLEQQASGADMVQGMKTTEKAADAVLTAAHAGANGALFSREAMLKLKAGRLERSAQKADRKGRKEKAEKLAEAAGRARKQRGKIARDRMKLNNFHAGWKNSSKVTKYGRASTKPLRMVGKMVFRTRVYKKTAGRPVSWAQKRLMRFKIWQSSLPVTRGLRSFIAAPFKMSNWIRAKAKKFLLMFGAAALILILVASGMVHLLQAYLPSFGESSVSDENPVSVMQQAVNYMVRRQNSYRYIISGEASVMTYKYNDAPYILPSEVHLNGELISTNDISGGVMHFSTGHEYTAQSVQRTESSGYKGETEPAWADAREDGAVPVTVVYKGANGSSVQDTLYIGSSIQQFLGHGTSSLSVPDGKYIAGWSNTDGGEKAYDRYEPFSEALQPTDGASGIVLYAVYEDEGYQQTVRTSTHTETITMIEQDEIYNDLRQYVTGQSVSVVFRYTDSEGNYQYVEDGNLNSYTQGMLYKAILCSAVVATDNDDSDPDIFMAYCGKLLDQAIRSCDAISVLRTTPSMDRRKTGRG